MVQHFIQGKLRVPVSANVLTYHETGLLFAQSTLTRRRTSQVCVHWTGSENAPSDVYRNMKNAKDKRGKPAPKSVHFVVDQSGTIYQMADANAFLAHATGINERAVGIEVVCPGDDLDVPHKGIVRDTVSELVHGKPCLYRAFLPAQTSAVLALIESLCMAYELPMTVPMRGDDVCAGVLTARELLLYRGVLGHYHTKATKRDPGVRIMRMIAARGQSKRLPVG